MANKMNLKEMMSISAYQFNRLDIGTRMAIVKKLEKIGNKRIEALRKSGLAPLSNALHSRSGKKFNTHMPLKVENIRKSRKPNLEKRLLKSFGQAKSFLGAKSSTKSGITEVYKKRAKTWNEKYGTDVSWEDLAKYYSKGINKKLERDMNSDVVNKAIAVIRSNLRDGKTIDDLRHLARLRKDGGHEFGYTKVSGADGQYDMIVDNAVHRILRSKATTEDLYMFLQR